MPSSMTKEELEHFENLIFLPMVITVFKQDRERISVLPFKFTRPYQDIIDAAIKSAETEFKVSKIYTTKWHLKLYKFEQTESQTIYRFHYRGHEEHRTYSHADLKARTEDLMSVYLRQGPPIKNS